LNTTLPFGASLRPLWRLEAGARFLNHGSYGACPREVLETQDRLRLEMEAQPDRFFRQGIVPRDAPTPLRESIARLASFVGSEADSVALVENATSAVQAVLRSVPLSAGDEILVNDHTYNAVRRMVEARCAETGASPRVVALPLPITPADIVQRFRDALTPRVRLAILDHITSPTAIVMPVATLIPELKRFGARILVDGAHAVGHLPLHLPTLGADWYTSNAHKWLFTPRGTAFLHAGESARAMTKPLVVSHYAGLGFPRAFDYVGTRDYTPWLSLPAAMAFHQSLEARGSAAYRARLIVHATSKLQPLGLEPIAPDEPTCALRSFRVPQRRAVEAGDAEALTSALWSGHRIQSMAVVFEGALLLRVSAQAYVGEEDIDALADALARDGWPGR
jgi:isopenicillin-N epimerase